MFSQLSQDWIDNSLELGGLGIIGGPDPGHHFSPSSVLRNDSVWDDEQSTAAFNKCPPVYQSSDVLASHAVIIDLFLKTQRITFLANTRTSENDGNSFQMG